MTKTSKPTRLPDKYVPGFLRKLDQRCEVSIRLTTAYVNVVADLGGEETLSHSKLALIERFVFLQGLLETWEAEIATNPTASAELVGKLVQATNAFVGLAKTLGLERRAKATIDLQTYLRGRAE